MRYLTRTPRRRSSSPGCPPSWPTPPPSSAPGTPAWAKATAPSAPGLVRARRGCSRRRGSRRRGPLRPGPSGAIFLNHPGAPAGRLVFLETREAARTRRTRLIAHASAETPLSSARSIAPVPIADKSTTGTVVLAWPDVMPPEAVAKPGGGIDLTMLSLLAVRGARPQMSASLSLLARRGWCRRLRFHYAGGCLAQA